MFEDGRLNKKYQQMYAASGETMFDIDRKNGGTINTCDAGIKFWQTIDSADAKNKWKWNYMGGEYAAKLKQLIPVMIRPIYDKFCKIYFTPNCLRIVNSDIKLTFNFIYAVYNGAYWFKYFANALKIYVEKQGINNVDSLIELMISERKTSGNALIGQGGNEMEKFINQIT